jgi:hypothetical protein
LPQAPQLFESLLRSAQAPLQLVRPELQQRPLLRVKPSLQVKPQVPLLQVGVAFCGDGQAFPQRPQLVVVVVSVQAPLQQP